MGGSTKSPKRKWAARLRELKKKGLTDANSKLLTDMITDKNSFTMDTLMWLQSMKKECNTIGEKTNVAKVLNDVCKIIHANDSNTLNLIQNNIKNEQFNIQINILPPKENDKDRLATKRQTEESDRNTV